MTLPSPAAPAGSYELCNLLFGSLAVTSGWRYYPDAYPRRFRFVPPWRGIEMRFFYVVHDGRARVTSSHTVPTGRWQGYAQPGHIRFSFQPNVPGTTHNEATQLEGTYAPAQAAPQQSTADRNPGPSGIRMPSEPFRSSSPRPLDATDHPFRSESSSHVFRFTVVQPHSPHSGSPWHPNFPRTRGYWVNLCHVGVRSGLHRSSFDPPSPATSLLLARPSADPSIQ